MFDLTTPCAAQHFRCYSDAVVYGRVFIIIIMYTRETAAAATPSPVVDKTLMIYHKSRSEFVGYVTSITVRRTASDWLMEFLNAVI